MKLHTNNTNIERGGVQSESAFTIKTNALSFSILSSGLYTDPIMAIVRELSCNAYDAHVQAKNQKTPFEIHLPNDLEPFLSIKDYGTGLSDEDIQGRVDENNVRTGGLYTTYFDSTKTESNDYIGALGLGSKSPFSYSSAFEVISRYNGHKHTYAIFLNEEGIPTVALMGSIETDEHSGLEVKIAIKSEDFYNFKSKTATALKYFPVKPKITGALNFQFNEISDYSLKTPGWMISPSRYYNNGSIEAIQGNVAYRVNTDQVKDKLSDSLKEFISHCNLVMFFNIGELEVSANREEVRYDKRSIQAIINRIEKVNNEFVREVEKKISKINKKYWYACVELDELSKELFNKSNAIQSFIDYKKVKNKNLKRYIEEAGRASYSDVYGYSLYSYSVKGRYNSSNTVKRSRLGNPITPNGATLFVINDVKTAGIKRLKIFLNENSYSRAIVIVKNDDILEQVDKDDKIIPYEGHEKELKRLTKEFGEPDIQLLSEITDKPKSVSANQYIMFYCFNGLSNSRGGYYDPDKISWEQIDYDIEDGGLYIPLKYGSSPSLISSTGLLEPLDVYDPHVMQELINFVISIYNKINDTSHTINDIYGVPTASHKKVSNHNKWINLFEFSKPHLQNYIPEIKYHKNKKQTSNVLSAKDSLKHTKFVEHIKKLDKNSTFKKNMMPIIEGMEKYKNSTSPYLLEGMEILYNHIHGDIKGKAFYDDTAFDKYPMLALASNISYYTDWSVLFDYINIIDRSKK